VGHFTHTRGKCPFSPLAGQEAAARLVSVSD
jgi:hypothetical protein